MKFFFCFIGTIDFIVNHGKIRTFISLRSLIKKFTKQINSFKIPLFRAVNLCKKRIRFVNPFILDYYTFEVFTGFLKETYTVKFSPDCIKEIYLSCVNF